MSVFLYLTNRMNSSYGDIEDTSVAEIRLHTFKVLCEWPFAKERWKLEKYLQPWAWIGSRTKKLPTNQQFYTLKGVRENWCQFGRNLRKDFGIGSWMNFQLKHPPIFQTFQATIWTLLKRITLNSSHSFSAKETSLRDDTSGSNLGEWYFWHTGCTILQSGT